jgi:hypothetical protein
MFDLNKIIEIIKENGKEIFLAKENEDPFVIMTLDRYRELLKTLNEIEKIGKDNLINKDYFFNDNIKDINPSTSSYLGSQMIETMRSDYPMQVKEAIMPERE